MKPRLNVVTKNYTVKIKHYVDLLTLTVDAESKEKARLNAISWCEENKLTNYDIISCEESHEHKQISV